MFIFATVVFAFILYIFFWSEIKYTAQHDRAIIALILFTIFYYWSTFVQWNFLRIVLRAQRYLRNVHLNPASNLPRV
jgi:hypothetical protein